MSTPIMANTPPGNVRPIVELGVGDRYDAANTAAVWGAARWSTAGDGNEWGGTEPLWHDVTCEVVDVATFTGRESSIDKFGIGTALVVVRNLDGWADYQPPGEYDSVLTIRPGRQLRIGVAIGAAPPRWLWRGVVDSVEYDYLPTEGPRATLSCVDAKGDAGRVQMPRTLEPVGAGEQPHTRIARTLDNVSWPQRRRALDAENVPLLGTQFGVRAADELDRTAESSSGHVFGDLNGNVCYRRKDWMTWPADTPPDATVGNMAAGDICPGAWELRYGRDDITTRVIAGRNGETPLVMDNADAAGAFGVETWERLDLLPIDDFEMSRIASRVLNVRSPAVMPRIVAVNLNAATGTGEVAGLLATCSPFKPSRLRCRLRTRDGRTVFDRIMMVTGIEHTMAPDSGWSARIALDDAAPHKSVDNPARWSDATTKWSDAAQWAPSL